MEILPVTRKERFLKAAMDSEPLTIDAVTRIETFLSKISGADVTIPDPVTKIEMYLASIAGADVVLPDPVTRVEKYLAKLAGMDVLVPEPITRIEQFLSDWVNQPSGVLKTISGAVVFVSDALARAAEDISVEINPIQDLHGYANPWPAGGGVNVLDISTCTPASASYGLTKTIDADGYVHCDGINEATGSMMFAVIKVSAAQKAALAGQGYTISIIDVSGGTILSSWGLRTESEDTIAISLQNPGVGVEIHLKFRVVVATSAQTAWSPYSNICPISGWTEAKVWRTGKNLFDKASAGRTSSNMWLGAATQNGSPDGSFILAAADYTLTSSEALSGLYIVGPNGNIKVAYNNTTLKFTLSAKTAIKVLLYKAGASEGYWDTVDIQLELGSTATAYEPYTGTTYSIDWTDEAGTVYGGSLDVTTGVLTVTWASIAKSSNPSLIGTYSDRKDYGWNVSDKKVGETNVMTQGFKTQALNGVPPINCVCGRGGNTYVTFGVPLENAGSASDAKDYILQYAPIIVYELATPLTIQLTPTEIQMLLGENTVWSENGDITLTYMADGNADDVEALNILLGNRYVNLGEPDEATDREALDILLGGR